MDIFSEQKAFEYFESEEIFDERKKGEIKDVKKLLQNALDILEKPFPQEALSEYFYTPEVLFLVSINIWNSISYDKRKILIQRRIGLDTLHKSYSPDKIHYSARVLGAHGRYPNIPFHSDMAIYTQYSGIPLLITQENDEERNNSSEVCFLNKNELLMAAGIILTSPNTRLHFSFDLSTSIDITSSLYLSLSEESRIPFFVELLGVLDIMPNATKYTYGNYIKEMRNLKAFLSIVDSDNQLLLRTLYLLTKSRMLWENGIFGEDAISNIFFAVEGALLLIQEANGGTSDKINLLLLEEIFAQQFHRGKDTFEFIKEAYEKRIKIVHPNPRGGTYWAPFLIQDDFYEYYEIVIELVNYYLMKTND